LPLTGKAVVDVLITEKCVFQVDAEKGLLLTEIAEGYTTDDIIKFTGCPINVNMKNEWFFFIFFFILDF
jgi:3-oxoacid CoA-transferase